MDEEKRKLRIYNKILIISNKSLRKRYSLLEEEIRQLKLQARYGKKTEVLINIKNPKRRHKNKSTKTTYDRIKNLPNRFCIRCFEKQRKIDQLEEEVARLKSKLRYQERTAMEGFFGLSTPSSKIPIKPNSIEENQKKKGGAVEGHRGYGRKKITREEADRVEHIDIGNICPDCGGELKDKDIIERAVIEILPIIMEKILYLLHKKECNRCGKNFSGKIPGVFEKCLVGNELTTHIAIQSMIYHVTLGTLSRQLGINSGTIIGVLHRLAKIFEKVPDKLIEEYRKSFVKHADETGWRNDGDNGYSWFFGNNKTSIFRFRDTRSSEIAHEVFGSKKLPGVLVVDRYNGYNKVPVSLQYSYSHLLREVEDLKKEFADNSEVKDFVDIFAPLLSEAMHLHSKKISNKEYYREAKKLKREILKVAEGSSAKHPGIQRIQDIFRNNEHRMYHWVKDRRVPADNNLAERELRPTVIARKVSFGSQSEKGAKTREILMTVLHTLKKRYPKDFAKRFKSALDKLALDPSLDPYKLLFNTS